MLKWTTLTAQNCTLQKTHSLFMGGAYLRVEAYIASPIFPLMSPFLEQGAELYQD